MEEDEFFVVGKIYIFARCDAKVKLLHIDKSAKKPLTFRWLNSDNSLSADSFTYEMEKNDFVKIQEVPIIYVIWIPSAKGISYIGFMTEKKDVVEKELTWYKKRHEKYSSVEIREYKLVDSTV